MNNWLRRWRALWNPDMYHGWGRQRKFFEGWYFKVVDPTEGYAYAFIPGISYGEVGESHAFVQVLDGRRNCADYHNFPVSEFRPAPDRFELAIGENHFAADRLLLKLPGFDGELRFSDRFPWPRMLGAPGIMGWYSFVPFMECYHGVVSVDHRIDGKLEIEGQEVDFSGGRGYTEKDWGQSFPSSWIWMQSNHFDSEKPVSLSASVARIPWRGSHFIGFIVGFLLEGRLYRFATYTGARMKAAIDEGKRTVRLSFSDRRYRLDITAVTGSAGALISPVSGSMTGKVNESMSATIDLQFSEGQKARFRGKGRNAGLEVAGPVEELLG